MWFIRPRRLCYENMHIDIFFLSQGETPHDSANGPKRHVSTTSSHKKTLNYSEREGCKRDFPRFEQTRSGLLVISWT